MADVPRETSLPPDPTILAQVFVPARLPLLERYAALLVSDGVLRGLIGPREVPRLWDRHLVNCGLLAPLVPEGARVADLGSGAGLPGLVLAIARPDLQVTLIEPMARRTAFLEEACASLGLSQVTVLRGRAEDCADSGPYDVVTARALAPLPRLLEWGLPLVASTGAVLAMKGSSAQEEVESAATILARWRARAEVRQVGVPGVSPTTIVRVVGTDASGIGWPSGTSRRQQRRGRG